MVGSHPAATGWLPSRRAQLNQPCRASKRTLTARIRRALALRSALTFRAVSLSCWTFLPLPFGLDTAPTSLLTPSSPAGHWLLRGKVPRKAYLA